MIERPNDGGPVFPCDGFAAQHAPGMSLRDWFAGQALTAFDVSFSHLSVEYSAKRAYEIADAMIAASRARRGI